MEPTYQRAVDKINKEVCEIMFAERDPVWPRPIPVSERPPNHGDVIMAYEPMYKWRVGVYETDAPFPVFNCREFIIGWHRVTHWLPSPPDPADAK